MNILYCGDVGVERGVLISILSLMKHCSEPLEIFVMTLDYGKTSGKKTLGNAGGNTQEETQEGAHKQARAFRKRTAEFLDFLVKNGTAAALKAEKGLAAGQEVGGGREAKRSASETTIKSNAINFPGNPQSFVRLIDATAAFRESLPRKNMGSYFTPASMLRLYLAKIPELAKKDRILYLDYDVVCRKDLKKFYHQNLDNLEAVGVLDIYGKHFYHYHGLLRQDYMNSGVMLFNIPECLKSKMFERAIWFCQNRRMMLADQAALNKAITKRKLAARKYNEQGERPRPETVLHHFSNNFKFWPYFKVQKIKPFEIQKVREILKITEYDDIFEIYERCLEIPLFSGFGPKKCTTRPEATDVPDVPVKPNQRRKS